MAKIFKAKIFKNEKELKQYLYKIEAEVIDAVSKKLLEDFQKHLRATIYGAAPGEYQRYEDKGGFFSGWEIITGVKSAINDYAKTLIFNGNRLIAPQNDMRNSQMSHGGRNGEDIRNMMAEILNNATYNDWYAYNGGAKYLSGGGVGYWTSYLEGVEDKIDKWFDDEFLKYGIKRG